MLVALYLAVVVLSAKYYNQHANVYFYIYSFGLSKAAYK